MAAEFAAVWGHAFTGFAAVPETCRESVPGFNLLRAAHPLPDEGSTAAGRIFLREAGKLAEGDIAVLLLSGGASAMLCAPPHGVSLQDKRAVCEQLLLSGAGIDEFNCVRRHISAIKGGRLAAAAYPASTLTLAVSDVPGDNPADIGSGPTVGDASSAGQAGRILAHRAVNVPESVGRHLLSAEAESLLPGDSRLSRSQFRLAASPALSLAAAAAVLSKAGYAVMNFGSCIAGEAVEAAAVFAGVTRSAVQEGVPLSPPAALLSGGELTVSGPGAGCGGPNTEFALAFALLTADMRSVHVMACDTDGLDGRAGAAGAVVAAGALAEPRMRERARSALREHDSAAFLDAMGALFRCPPTAVNVNDIRVILAD